MKYLKTFEEFVSGLNNTDNIEESVDVYEKKFSDEKRTELADKGFALPDGSFPIENMSDLKNAIQAHGRAKDIKKAKEHIIKRAKDLGKEDLIPSDWK